MRSDPGPPLLLVSTLRVGAAANSILLGLGGIGLVPGWGQGAGLQSKHCSYYCRKFASCHLFLCPPSRQMKPSEHLLPCHIFSAGFPGAYTYARTLKPVLVQQPLPWRTIKMLPSKHLAIDESCNHNETFPRPTVLEEHHILFLASLKLHLLFRLNTLQHTLIFQLTNMKASGWALHSWPSTKGTAQICHSWTVDYLMSVHLKIYFKGTHCAAQQFSLAHKTEIALQCLIHIYSFTELYFGNTFSIP